MHSPIDVVGGRILATALAAATLCDPQFAALKTAARAQAAGYFQAQTGSTADTLYASAHSDVAADPYANRVANRAAVVPRLTYTLPRLGNHQLAMVVPTGAEVLLETRLPYLDAAQRREVLRTTALPSGYVLLDGPEQWGRLNLFAAADGYGAFGSTVRVDMNAADGGFSAVDSWRNDIGGRGGLVKTGTGSLTLTGANRYAGGTLVQAGTLVAGAPHALGTGDVRVQGGTLRLLSTAQVSGAYVQTSAGVLAVTLGADRELPLTIDRSAVLGPGSVLELQLDAGHKPPTGTKVSVLRSRGLSGTFVTITVGTPGYAAIPVYSPTGVSVRLVTR
jgi:autotransporter-associated beta strand protein